jgi:hypothetical protein
MRKRWGTLFACILFSSLLAAGCGGTDPSMTGDSPDLLAADGGGVSVGDGGLLGVNEVCTDNSQCVSMVCTKEPYDRKPLPVCTYACDPTTNTNPLCPQGCNMKHFCKLP